MKFLLIFFLLPIKLLAQDITGVWTGTLYNDTTRQYLKYELAISDANGKLSGYSHTIFLIDSIKNTGLKSIKIKKSGKHYFIEDDKLIYNNYIEPAAKGVKTYSNLLLSQTDSTLTLSGPWKTNRTKIYESITGNILLHKKKEIQQTLIIPKLEELGLANTLSFMNYNNYAKDIASINKPANPQVANNSLLKMDETKNSIAENDSKNFGTKNGIQKEIVDKKNQSPSDKNLNEKEIAVNNQKQKNNPIKNDTSFTNKNNIVIAQNNTATSNNKKNQSAAIDNLNNTNTTVQKEIADNQNQKRNIKADTSFTNKNNIVIAQNNTATSNNKKNQSAAIDNLNNTNTTVQKEIVGNQNQKRNIKADTSFANKNNIATVQTNTNKTINKNEKNLQVKETAKNILAGNDTLKISAINIEKEKNKSNSLVSPILSGTKDIVHPAPVIRAAAEISSRKIETVRSVNIKNDSLTLTLYDNGEIDGDTVSVLLNGKVIMPMQGLTAKGISKTIHLTPEMGDSIELIMYAENLGSIPPNTGLLVVHDGDAVYEIRFSGDLQKNSAIILRRKMKTL